MKEASGNALNQLIQETRSRNYKNAKEFWEEHQEELAVSYSHYAAIESAKKYPDIKLAVAISKILKINLRLCCHLWAKDHMPDSTTRAFFEPVPGTEVQGRPSNLLVDLDAYYVFSDLQAEALKKNPYIWDTLCFILAFSLSTAPSEKDVVLSLGFPEREVRSAIEWLRNEGIIFAENDKLKTRRRHFHLPNTAVFKEIRDQNFLRISQDIIKKIKPEDLASKEAFRTTFLRRLTRKQAVEISLQIDSVIGTLGNMDDIGTEYYGITIAFAPRAKLKGEPKKEKK